MTGTNRVADRTASVEDTCIVKEFEDLIGALKLRKDEECEITIKTI